MSRDVPLTFLDIPWDIFRQNCSEYVSNELKTHLQTLLNIIETQVTAKTSENREKHWIGQTLVQLEICLDRTWEELNTGHWKDISISHRYCYTLCSALKCIVLEVGLDDVDCEKRPEIMSEIVQQIDKGLLLGAPLPQQPDLLTKMAARVAKNCSNHHESIPRLDVDVDDNLMELLSGFTWINRWKTPSMETFYREILSKKFPAVLEDCISHWRALTLWKDPNYLIKIAGMRTVPIELGSRYTEDDWSQHLLTFSEFIRSHIAKNNSQVGYLAQHQLFDQIPELKDDFSIPDYCSFSEDSEDTLPDINAWFGPRGTISPLHYDPKNNLLCQVLGCKKIIMYPPDESTNLYPYDTRLLANTAQVDPLNPDLKSFPNFANARGLMCYLKPGEMLYIPPKWWHYVVSLSPSFSVSFWWI